MTVYDRQTLCTSAEMAAVAELAYLGEDGWPRVEPLTPLPFDGGVVFALPYARVDLARRLSETPQVSLTFSDSRLAYVGWSPLAVRGRVEVIPDPEGDLFLEKLLYWELRKYGPSRELIGSLVLRRDNWWYVPRLVLRLVESEAPRPAARRSGPEHGVLAWRTGEDVVSEPVRVEDWEAGRVIVRPASGFPLPDGVPAALLYHDFSVPDRDLRATLRVIGRLEGGRLVATSREGSRALGKRPGILARWRAQKELERRCKAGLKDPAWGEG
jgi:hypothetical protein